ncbi:MAG: dTDP-4-dehydrorhamnose 3,5-epimerase [Xanthobacteraceae bacterium]|jgi:dTDP-4-dehydrorhamnose 3,5-epimerase
MLFEPLAIEGAFRIAIEPICDERGFFARLFSADAFAERGLEADFVQRSISYNHRRGTLRGLHYQIEPHGETKIVRCSRGSAFDVLVDLRPDSPSYGRWQAVELTSDSRLMVYIPAGCAHGFQTLADDTELTYEITPAYLPAAAQGIAWDDPDLAIRWPVQDPILSAADRNWPRLTALTQD